MSSSGSMSGWAFGSERGLASIWNSSRFLQGDVHVAMRAGHFFADGVGRKFNVLLTKEAGHF
jgi:hypothetical protein